MLAVPLIKVEGALDTSYFGRFLRNRNNKDEEKIGRDIAHFEQLRREAVNCSDPTEGGMQNILLYTQLIKSLQNRLVGSENEAGLQFSWRDAFSTGKREVNKSLLFELACCLWNLGALESLRGARLDRNIDEGARTAAKNFQQAAGYFDYIREKILPKLPATNPTSSLPCLSNDSLNMAKQLVLAQAQLCFYEKAIRDKKKDNNMKAAIVAKLSAQCSTFYSTASIACRTGIMGSLLDPSWASITDFQSKIFRAASEYWQALGSKETALQKGSGFGEEIARYNRAENLLRAAIESGKKNKIALSILGSAETLLGVIASNKQTAIHDLNTVYMESVPSEASLAEVVGVPMVKVFPLPEIPSISGDRSPFDYLVPIEIFSLYTKTNQELQSISQNSNVECENAMNLGRMTLSSVGLPGSLEASKSDQPISENLWKKIQQVNLLGGYDRLKTSLQDLQTTSTRSKQTIQQLQDRLRQQQQQLIGSTYQPQVDDIRNNLLRLQDAFEKAQINDIALLKDLQPSNNNANSDLGWVEILNKFTLSLESFQQDIFSNAPPPQPISTTADLLDLDIGSSPSTKTKAHNAEEVTVIHQLEDKLHELAELFEQYQTILKKISDISSKDSYYELQQCFMQENFIPSVYFDSLLIQIKENQQQLYHLLQTQESILQSILSLNNQFVQLRDTNPELVIKNQKIQSIEETISKYHSLQSRLSAGLNFYNKLQNELIVIQSNIDELIYTQQWQQQEDEAQRQAQEQEERDLAARMASTLQFSATPAVVSPVNNAPSTYYQPPQAPTSISGAPVISGTPVSGPPQQYYNPPPQQPQHPVQQTVSYPQLSAVPAIPPAPQSTPSYYSQPPQPPTTTSVPVSSVPANSTYQYNSHAYNVNSQPPAPAPAQYTPPPQSNNPAYNPAVVPSPSSGDMDSKIARLMEMGFERDSVAKALSASGWNEETALNILLSSPAGPAVPSKPTTSSNQKSSGGFSFFGTRK